MDSRFAVALAPFFQPPRVNIGGDNIAFIFHHGGQSEGFSAGAGAIIQHAHSRLYAADKRNKLRAFILDFDKPFRIGLGG